MKKYILIILAIIVLLGGYYFYYKNKSSENNNLNETQVGAVNETNPNTNSNTNTVTETTTTPNQNSNQTYTLADISKHNSKTSCWTAINGKVYDVTAFIPDHPGGNEILKSCGKDGTSLFSREEEHVEQNAQATLDLYQIGILKN